MVESCLEHIPKLILIGKSLANYLYMYVCYVCMLCILCMYSMYVFYVYCIYCMYCMYCMYVRYVCTLCMYSMYSTYAFRICVCKASWLSRPPGAKIHDFRPRFLSFSISIVYPPSQTLGVVIQYGKWSAHQGASFEMVSSNS